MSSKIEKNLLKFSVISAIGFALLGFIWGFAINSQMLIFDGIYSFISVILSGISLYVADFIKKEDDDQFQFGRAQIEPIAIVFKSLAIFSICLYAFINAIKDIANGGSSTNIESAILYSIIATLACLISWLFISLKMKKVKNSNLLMVEKYQWLMDTLLSSAVLIGFVIAFFLKETKYEYLIKYIDPTMVVIVTLYFFKMPITTLKNSLKELLLMAPEPDSEISIKIDNICQVIRRKYSFDEVVTRVAKTGRELSLEISFISENPDFSLTLYEYDLIRDDIEEKIKKETTLKLWLTVAFMSSRKHS
tara:strand:- start:175 stop:1092 length:918 start_codon:yes stop_codon:yes gene_type:complete